MAQFTKIDNIFKAEGKKVYSDLYGELNIQSASSVTIYGENTKSWHSSEYVFIRTHKDKYKSLNECYNIPDEINGDNAREELTNSIENIFEIFDQKLFVTKERYYSYYHRSRDYTPNDDSQAEEIDFKEIRISYGKTSLEIDKGDKNPLEGWVAENDNWTLRTARFHQLKQGDLVNYQYKAGNNYEAGKNCTCEVIEVFEQPNYDNKVCNIKSLKNGEVYTIGFKDTLKFVPYVERKLELEGFNEYNNEAMLSPFVKKNGETINVYWQSIEEACQYVVSLYKRYSDTDAVGMGRLYHLKDYSVDRNTCFLAVTNLVGDDYIITVSAEDRSGNIIAKSRGINNSGLPQFGWGD